MHTLEPHYRWRNYYVSENDERSPFFGKEYSEFYFTHTIYDHYIHPQWDYIGSDTLFLKIIYADYNKGFVVIEFLGEWNDCLFNDIMFLKRNVLEVLIKQGIKKFILIGENIFNFHASDDSYYQEWYDDIEQGWIAGVNFRDHVRKEFETESLDDFITFGGILDDFDNWRSFPPQLFFQRIDDEISHRIGI